MLHQLEESRVCCMQDTARIRQDTAAYEALCKYVTEVSCMRWLQVLVAGAEDGSQGGKGEPVEAGANNS